MGQAVNIEGVRKASSSTIKNEVFSGIEQELSTKRNFFQQLIYSYKCRIELKKTLKAIEQVKQIREGKKPKKSFEQSIKDL